MEAPESLGQLCARGTMVWLDPAHGTRSMGAPSQDDLEEIDHG